VPTAGRSSRARRSLPRPAAAAAEEAPREAPRVVFDNPAFGEVGAGQASSASNLVAIGAILILLIAAVALLVALVIK
jgi:hypothetical protein